MMYVTSRDGAAPQETLIFSRMSLCRLTCAVFDNASQYHILRYLYSFVFGLSCYAKDTGVVKENADENI